MYRVTKRFITGPLQGLAITETTPVQFQAGATYAPCAGASAYVVDACCVEVAA